MPNKPNIAWCFNTYPLVHDNFAVKNIKCSTKEDVCFTADTLSKK